MQHKSSCAAFTNTIVQIHIFCAYAEDRSGSMIFVQGFMLYGAGHVQSLFSLIYFTSIYYTHGIEYLPNFYNNTSVICSGGSSFPLPLSFGIFSV